MAHLDEWKRAKITEEVARKRKDVLEEIDELLNTEITALITALNTEKPANSL